MTLVRESKPGRTVLPSGWSVFITLFFYNRLQTSSTLTPLHTVQCKIVCDFLLQFTFQIFSWRSRASVFLLFCLPQEWPQPTDRARSGNDGSWTALELEGWSRQSLLSHAAVHTGRGRKKTRRESTSCRTLSPVLPDMFSSLSICN